MKFWKINNQNYVTNSGPSYSPLRMSSLVFLAKKLPMYQQFVNASLLEFPNPNPLYLTNSIGACKAHKKGIPIHQATGLIFDSEKTYIGRTLPGPPSRKRFSLLNVALPF